LPVDSEGSSSHAKVLELAELTNWSDGHVWCSPEHHGSMSGVYALGDGLYVPYRAKRLRQGLGLFGAAGLVAGGLAAALYATQCTDDSPLFIATWYSIAIGAVTVLGAVLGRHQLRW
jgi:NAD(P)H-dependent FMN reductase